MFLSHACIVLVVLLATKATSSQDYEPNSLLVRYAPGLAAQAAPRGVRIKSVVGSQGVRKLEITDGSAVDTKLAELKATPGVLYAEKNWRLNTSVVASAVVAPNDPMFGQQWHLPKVAANQAWQVTKGSEKIKVCVIDTGADPTHPDLPVKRGYNEIPDKAGPTNFSDGNGHGSHVTGIIAARTDNKIGVSGLAWNVEVVACRFLDAKGNGYLDGALDCLKTCREAEQANITSNSWGGGSYSQALYDEIKACEDAGQLFVAAAGNEWTNTDLTVTDPASEVGYPAVFNLNSIISVAATDSSDKLTWFSNYGKTTVDLAAPGMDIRSTWSYGRYATESGTSMATPMVTGAAVLVHAAALAAGTRLTALQVKDILLQSVDAIPGLPVASGGRLNVNKAVQAAVDRASKAAEVTTASYTLRHSLYVPTILGCKAWGNRSRQPYRKAAAAVTGLPLASVASPSCQCARAKQLRVVLTLTTGKVELARAQALLQQLKASVGNGAFWRAVRAVSTKAQRPSAGDGSCLVNQGMACPAVSIRQNCPASQLKG